MSRKENALTIRHNHYNLEDPKRGSSKVIFIVVLLVCLLYLLLFLLKSIHLYLKFQNKLLSKNKLSFTLLSLNEAVGIELPSTNTK